MARKLAMHDHGSASYDASLNDDHFQAHITSGQRGKRLRITTPTQVLRVSSRSELKAALDNFRREAVGLRFVVEDSNVARRRYVESVRPCLRYYCAKFGMTVPDWLTNDDRYTSLTDGEKMRMFGTDHLNIKEFKKVKMPKLQVGGANA